MVDLGRLGFILVGLFTRVYFSTAYDSGSLCMYHAMTFYESFGLEIAYKIVKRKLASRVYVFTNLTQVWSGDETVKYTDQIFMLMIGRTARKDNLFEKLEEVNFQTGFELIGEKVIDGYVPYLDWASSYIPLYDTANETTTPEYTSTSISDTNEAFTFRENFIDKKYGTHDPNQTTFSDLNSELTTRNSTILDSTSQLTTKMTKSSTLPTIEHLNPNMHQNSNDRITKGDRFPPTVTFPHLEAEKDNEMREKDNTIRETDDAIDEKKEHSIRENQRLIREQKAREFRRNFRRREPTYDERNLARIHPRMRQQRYARQNALDMYDRVPRRYYEQQNAADWYDKDTPRDEEENEPDWIERNLPKYFERGNARESYEKDESEENEEPNAQDWPYEPRLKQTTNVQNLYRNGKRGPVWSNSAKTSRSRSIMDIIKNFINPSASASNEVTIAGRAKVARGNYKMRRRPRARKVNQDRQPYKVIYDDDVENLRNYRQNNPVHHYIFVQSASNRNFNKDQKQRNERRGMRSRRSRVRKNERQAARARQTIRAGRSGRANSYYQHQMNYADEMNHGENVRANMKYHYAPSAADIYQQEHVFGNRNPINNHDNERINQYHAPGIQHPRAENNFAYFHQINEAADHLNELTRLHEIAKGRNPPPHLHQSDPFIHVIPMHGNINSARRQTGQFADHDRHHGHEMQHVIMPQHEHYQSYRARPAYNPNNLPVLHKTADRRPNHLLHNPEVIHLQNSPKSRARSPPKSKQFWRANPRSARAKKSKMATAFHHQYNNVPDTGVRTTIHFVDVQEYHYEPRQDMRMIQ